MSEYINKQQAIDLIESMIADKGVAFNPHKLAMALKDMESVEIVHCKDCIHCADDWNGNEPMFTCELARCCESVYPDDFCSYGEKQVTGKLESVEKATSEGEESTMGQPKSKLESDTISRQAAIEAMAPFDTNHELRDTLESLPPVEPPKKVVAQIKVDIDEIIERIKEEYKIKDRPVCEDAISRKWVLNEIITKVENDDSLTDEQKGSLSVAKYIIRHAPPVTPTKQQELGRLVDADKLLQETFIVDEEEWTTPEIRAILENAPPVEPKQSELHIDEPRGYTLKTDKAKAYSERPKGEWVDFDLKPAPNGVPVEKCGNCGEWSTQMGKNFCPWCGVDMDMRGDLSDSKSSFTV